MAEPSYDVLQYINAHVSVSNEILKRVNKRKITVEFTVSETGKIVNVHVLNSADPFYDPDGAILETEAIKVVSHMPDWSPGERGGKPTRQSFTTDVWFQRKA